MVGKILSVAFIQSFVVALESYTHTQLLFGQATISLGRQQAILHSKYINYYGLCLILLLYQYECFYFVQLCFNFSLKNFCCVGKECTQFVVLQEVMAAELEDDSNECPWNSSSYLPAAERNLWYNNRLISPGGDSWSSAGTNSEDGRSVNDCGKRSSTAMSSDSGESPVVGTDFTRDFYRLVKFESTKSLASTSSRGQSDSSNLKKCEIPVTTPLCSEREETLQSVLHFIAEQQHYVLSQEVMDTRQSEVSLEEMSPSCEEDLSKDTVKEIVQICKEVKRLSFVEVEDQNNPAEKRPLSGVSLQNDYNSSSLKSRESHKTTQINKLYENSSESMTVVLDTSTLDSLSNCSNPVQNSLTIDQESKIEINVPLNTPKSLEEAVDCDSCLKNEQKNSKTERSHENGEPNNISLSRTLRVEVNRPGLKPVPEEDEEHHAVSTADTVTLSVHKTSKDVIEELNRMIRKGEESTGDAEITNTSPHQDTSYPTGWVRVHRDLDFTDPKVTNHPFFHFSKRYFL